MTDDFWGKPISVYSRAQAIADGVLIDVTETAKQAGWKYPVAINDNAWAMIVPSAEVADHYGCDEAGRLWDVLWMGMLKARSIALQRGAAGSVILFDLILPQTVRDGNEHIVQLKAVCGPGDTPEPVITIMRPQDD